MLQECENPDESTKTLDIPSFKKCQVTKDLEHTKQWSLDISDTSAEKAECNKQITSLNPLRDPDLRPRGITKEKSQIQPMQTS